MSSSGPVMDWDWLTPSLTFQSYSRVQTPLLTLVLRATPRKIIPSTLHEKRVLTQLCQKQMVSFFLTAEPFQKSVRITTY